MPTMTDDQKREKLYNAMREVAKDESPENQTKISGVLKDLETNPEVALRIYEIFNQAPKAA